jgi:hypothetical protein
MGNSLPIDLRLIGLPGCAQYVSLDATVPLASQGSTASWNIPIPNDPSLATLEFFLQTVVLDLSPTMQMPPAPISVSVSNATQGVIALK